MKNEMHTRNGNGTLPLSSGQSARQDQAFLAEEAPVRPLDLVVLPKRVLESVVLASSIRGIKQTIWMVDLTIRESS